MNEANLEYLKKTLNYLGFGTKLNDVVESAITKEIQKFSVGINTRFEPPLTLGNGAKQKDIVQFTLDFNKAKETDTYYLNDYTAYLTAHDGTSRSQQFNLERDLRVTANQAYRLLLGAALQKETSKRPEGENTVAGKTKVWMKLNLDVLDSYGRHPVSKTYPAYGFDLHSVLEKYPISGLKENELPSLITEVEKGMLPRLTMEIEGRITPVIISANPQMKNLDVYDLLMNQIKNDRIFTAELKSDPAQRVELTDQHQVNEHKFTGNEFQAGDTENINQQSRSRGR